MKKIIFLAMALLSINSHAQVDCKIMKISSEEDIATYEDVESRQSPSIITIIGKDGEVTVDSISFRNGYPGEKVAVIYVQNNENRISLITGTTIKEKYTSKTMDHSSGSVSDLSSKLSVLSDSHLDLAIVCEKK